MRIRMMTAAVLAGGGLLAACGAPETGGDVEAAAPAGEVAAETEEAAWTAPRTSWGEPDLRGMWPVDYLNGTPVQRPPEFGDRRTLTDEEFAEREARLGGLNARYDEETESDTIGQGHWTEMGEPNRLTSLIVEPANGRVPPLTPAGQAKSATMTSSWSDIDFDGIDDFNPLDRCITRGLPASMFPFMYNSGIEIMQGPGFVAIRLEIIHETRIVPTDGRPPLSPAIHQWMGDSRGRWEGDTLVVETANFNGASPMLIVGPAGNPIPTSESLRLVERLTRTGPDAIDYQITVEDPEMLTGPWTASLPWRLNPDYEIYEYACHEGNHIVRDLINATRYEQAQAADSDG